MQLVLSTENCSEREVSIISFPTVAIRFRMITNSLPHSMRLWEAYTTCLFHIANCCITYMFQPFNRKSSQIFTIYIQIEILCPASEVQEITSEMPMIKLYFRIQQPGSDFLFTASCSVRSLSYFNTFQLLRQISFGSECIKQHSFAKAIWVLIKEQVIGCIITN